MSARMAKRRMRALPAYIRTWVRKTLFWHAFTRLHCGMAIMPCMPQYAAMNFDNVVVFP